MVYRLYCSPLQGHIKAAAHEKRRRPFGALGLIIKHIATAGRQSHHKKQSKCMAIDVFFVTVSRPLPRESSRSLRTGQPNPV